MKKFTIKAPDGMIINETKIKDGIIEFIPEKNQNELPNKWGLEKDKTYYYIDNRSEIDNMYIDLKYSCGEPSDHNCLPTEELAKAMLSFIKLITMRERYRDESNHYPYIIYGCGKIKNHLNWCGHGRGGLTFQSSEIRDLFSKNFHDDIMICVNAGLI